ncbi:MAG TPA: carbonic anhydrase [Chloroflexota bacterium]
MTTIDTLLQRNEEFAVHRFAAGLSLMPTLGTMIIGCVDPRVDPAHVLGLQPGEAIVIRNIGGRITPATLQMMALLGMIPQLEGAGPVSGLNLVVLQHTDCGITRLARVPDRLAAYLGVAAEELEAEAVGDPYAAVAVDVAALKANPSLPSGTIVSGAVYDVATGRVAMVTPPEPLRAEGAVA